MTPCLVSGTVTLLRFVVEWISLPFLSVSFLHAMVGMRLLRRLKPLTPPSESDGSPLDVSVLVPARNEEERIGECLRSLAAQEPPVREVLLLDDRSSDNTLAIARELGFSEEPGSRLRIVRGKDLPEGWVGKNWACHQLSLAADPASAHLLFTDADTVHGPSCVRTALDHASRTRADLLSVWPDQVTGSWSEKLIIPLGYLLFTAFQPLPLLSWLQGDVGRARGWSRERLGSLGAANGQFLLFRRDSYLRLGGHEALKDHLVEDIAFGRRVASRTGEGMRLINADGIELLRCRMYRDFEGVWEGFSKNLRPVFERSGGTFVLFGVMVVLLFLLPVFVPLLPGGEEPGTLAALFLLILLRLLLTLRYRTAWLGFFWHPAGILLALAMAFNSWRLCRSGGVRWKGRSYPGMQGSALG